MNDYIRQWNEVIVNGSVDNTYKMAWARSIIELCVEKEQPQNEVVFDFKEIAKKYIPHCIIKCNQAKNKNAS